MISERVSSFFFLVLSLAFLGGVLGMPIGKANHPGPGFMPLFLSLFMAILSGVFTLKAFSHPGKPSGETEERGQNKYVILLILGLIGYCALLPFVGFLVLTFIFLVVFMRLLGVPKWSTILAFAATASIVSTLLFEIWLAVPFPKGVWWPD